MTWDTFQFCVTTHNINMYVHVINDHVSSNIIFNHAVVLFLILMYIPRIGVTL